MPEPEMRMLPEPGAAGDRLETRGGDGPDWDAVTAPGQPPGLCGNETCEGDG